MRLLERGWREQWEKQKKKLFGQDLITNLNKRLALLDKQIGTTTDKIKIAKGSSYINKIDNGNNNKIYSAIKEKKIIENQTKEVKQVENETNIHISFSIDINEIFSLFTGSKRKRENEH